MSHIGGFLFTVKKELRFIFKHNGAHRIHRVGQMNALGSHLLTPLVVNVFADGHGDKIGFSLASREERFLPALLLSLRPFFVTENANI